MTSLPTDLKDLVERAAFKTIPSMQLTAREGIVFREGFISGATSLYNHLKGLPDERDKDKLWLLLTEGVCERDMSGLNYYKQDLLDGLSKIMSHE